VLREKQKDCCL